MKINGIEGMTPQQLQEEIRNGAKFVIYRYCISFIIITIRRSSDIYFIRPGQNRVLKGLEWTLLTFFFGWWGIPWGPIYSIGSLSTNLAGGKDVTDQIQKSLDIHSLTN
jgi:hypothetical protein